MDGILVINKEKGYTSHDVVAVLRRILHMKKIGHTGTLDPEAEGVLPVVLGRGTGLSSLLTEKRKAYDVRLRLGITTDTQDITGNVLEYREVCCTPEEIREAAASFEGEGMQLPPMYSAVRVNGRHLYELAREGRTVERTARPVCFYRIEVKEICLPEVRLFVECSKGTYIRTLCADLGEKLGCGGAMVSLLRTRSGDFVLEDSVTLKEAELLFGEGRLGEKIIPVEKALERYEAFRCPPLFDRLLLNGNPVPCEEKPQGSTNGAAEEKPQGSEADSTVRSGEEMLYRMYLSDGRFIALYTWEEKRKRLFPVKMFGIPEGK